MKVLITGASGEIGQCAAFWIAAHGHQVVLGCRSQKKADWIIEEMEQKHGKKLERAIFDLSDASSVSRAANALADAGLDAIVHIAGVMNEEYIADADGYEDTINVNYRNTRLLTELLLPSLGKNGAVVFTTSATRWWYPFQRMRENVGSRRFGRLKTYALSKKLITRYAASLADSETVKEKRIRVNCVDPGVVNTPMLRMNRWYDRLTDKLFRPFCLNPWRVSPAYLRAIVSPLGGYIFFAPFGKMRNHRKLKLQ